MAVAITKDYSTHEWDPKLGGDVALLVLFLDYTGVYPVGGEQLDLSAYFHEVHGITMAGYSALPGGGVWNSEVYFPTFRQQNNTTWLSQFWEQDGAAGQLVELGIGASPPGSIAYDSDFRLTVFVFGRPVEDGS